MGKASIKIHIFHTGKVCVSPHLPFGGDDCSTIKASGLFGRRKDRLWIPVSTYLIEHPKGRFLVDTGWSRDMSPHGTIDRHAQIKSLGSPFLYMINQGYVPAGMCIDEQLASIGIKAEDIDAVLLTHLDCDHVNGLKQVSKAKRILVSKDELIFASGGMQNKIRYQEKWWEGLLLTAFEWNDTQGPARHSYDLLGDGSIELINIPGHSDGLFAVKVINDEGRFVLLFSDGGYSDRSWKEQITSGIAADKAAQKRSLEWIREQSMDPDCLESIANHDPEIRPHIIIL